MEQLIKEAVELAKKDEAYSRILKEIFKRYKKLGRLGGNIEIKNTTEREKLLLSTIDYRYFEAEHAKISVMKFIDFFCNGRFGELSFKDFLEAYFQKELISNKELKGKKESEKDKFFKAILNTYKDTKGALWLEKVLELKTYGYNGILGLYEKEPIEKSKYILSKVIEGLNSLSFSDKELQRLPLFASKITKDPHFFDTSNLAGKLLIQGIGFLCNRTYPENAEETSELLYISGLLRDHISNFTIGYGLEGYDLDGRLLNWKSFAHRKEPLQLCLANLVKVKEITTEKKQVFVVENPTVFSEIMSRTEDLNISLICTSGQLKLSSLVLLDKLKNKADRIYYAGDFDPEGIQIADKLKRRYGEKLILWRYTIEDYEKIKSSKEMGEKREKILKNLKSEELKIFGAHLIKQKKCAYQELLIDDYVRDIRERV